MAMSANNKQESLLLNESPLFISHPKDASITPAVPTSSNSAKIPTISIPLHCPTIKSIQFPPVNATSSSLSVGPLLTLPDIYTTSSSHSDSPLATSILRRPCPQLPDVPLHTKSPGHNTIPLLPNGPLLTLSPVRSTSSPFALNTSPGRCTSPPFPDEPLHTSSPGRCISPSLPDEPLHTSSPGRCISPPLPDGRLHTTRSESSGSSSEDEVTSDLPVLNPIKSRARGAWLQEEMTKKRRKMHLNVPEDESVSCIEPTIKWEPSHQSGIPSWDKSLFPSESESGEVIDIPSLQMNEDILPSSRQNSSDKAGQKDRMLSELLGEDGEWGAVKCEMRNIEAVPDERVQSLDKPGPTWKQMDTDVWVMMTTSGHGEKEKEKHCSGPVMLSEGLSSFVREFKAESKKPPAIDRILSDKEKNDKVKVLHDKDEVVVVNRRCLVRTTKEGIEKSRRDWEESENDANDMEVDEFDEKTGEIDIEDDELINFSKSEFEDELPINDEDEEDSFNNDEGDFKMKIRLIKKRIRAEERKPLINERMVNKLRNKVLYLERKIEEEKRKLELRKKRDRKNRASIELDETSISSDDEIQIVNSSDDEEDIRIIDEGDIEISSVEEGEDEIHIIDQREDEINITSEGDDDDVKILNEDSIRSDGEVNHRSLSEDVEIVSAVESSELLGDLGVWGAVKSELWNDVAVNEEAELGPVDNSPIQNSSAKAGEKISTLSELFGEEGDWGAVKSDLWDDDI